MVSEAVVCSAPSRLFSGLCFSDNNCSAICEKEGFLSGECKGFKCICQKDCNGGGSGGGDGGDPGQGPPEQGGGDQSPVVNRKYLIKS